MRARFPLFAATLLLAVLCTTPAAAQSAGVADESSTLRPVTAAEVMEAVHTSAADVVVVNMWATWCVPCVEEFPDLVRLGREIDDVDVLFVSADFEEALPQARAFLREQGVSGPTFLKAQKDDAFVRGLSEEWSGALPATFVYDKERNLARFWEGKSTYDELKTRVMPLL